MKQLKSILFFSIVLLSTKASLAQDMPVGLFEGLLGNSGAATFEPTAPSYYNPALLSLRKKSSIVVGGNTISTIVSKTDTSDTSGSSFNPTYVSNIDIFEPYAHEFFIVNIVDANLFSEATSDDVRMQFYLRTQNLAAGYSFAFPQFPMGFQVALYQMSTNGVAPFDGILGTRRTVGHVRVDVKSYHLGLGISTILNYKDYNLGFNFRTRTAQLNKTDKSRIKDYVYDSGSNSFNEGLSEYKSDFGRPEGHTLLVGQAFRSGAHEFLTDSSFVESSELDQSYQWRQSYGYRLGLKEDHQFLVGLNHLINDKVKYFGQDAYYSVGYSWKTRSYRSSVGLFLRSEKVTSYSQIYGLTFDSEFTY